MKDIPVKILLVEDNFADARLLSETLMEIAENKFELTHVQQLDEAMAKLAEYLFDAILLDLSLPDSQGLETLESILSAVPDLPIIVLTGLKDENTGIKAVRKGAQDYLVKGQASSYLLIRAINYSIERKRIQEELRKARDELEMRVKERTVKLEKAIEELRDEILLRIEAERKIRADQEQLRSLTAELVLAEERERHSVAVALHDSLGPILAFSKRELGTLQKSVSKTAADTLKNIGDNISQAIKQTRNLTFDLSPPALYTFGLETAVAELTERFGEDQKLKIIFENTDEPKPLTDHVKVLLYRSIREILINIVKHAEAKSVRLVLSKTYDKIKIVVEDDGKGFNVSDLDSRPGGTKGFGLFSIRERLMHIGGSFNIQSGMGRGTTVTLLAPLDLKEAKKEV
jgi:signal transduction histidine kinase